MARVIVEIPDNKRVEISLTYIHGIGRTTAQAILTKAGIDSNKKVKDLTSDELMKIRTVIESDYKVEGEKRQEVFQDIKRLKEIKTYRGLRHKQGLPVRGQRTRCNARTRKGKNVAVGGLNKQISKK